jgi:hypothetical protein
VVTFKKVQAVYFKLKPDQILYITSPIKYKENIESIILTKSAWIRNHFTKLGGQNHLISENSIYFFGNLLDIKIEQIRQGKQNYLIEKSAVILYLKNPSKKDTYLDQILKVATYEYINSILPVWINKTGLSPTCFTVRKMKKWGACTKGGKIIFSSYLICLPPVLIDYIVCHELVHLLHFDHSKKFHLAVADFLPDVKKLEKELKMFVR